ncbi:MAG: DUF6364 family protein [Candidatus Micrarchaeia archaeon]
MVKKVKIKITVSLREDVYDAARDAATAKNESLSSIIEKLLRNYPDVQRYMKAMRAEEKSGSFPIVKPPSKNK